MSKSLQRIAELLRNRNAIDAQIAAITNRPMTSGHLGEWIASQLFGIALEPGATAPGIDGRFTTGLLAGKTVNVKWYLKREGLLDIGTAVSPDYYLVLCGPLSGAVRSAGTVRPWCISAVYLFETERLYTELRARRVKVGIASSVVNAQWAAAEIYPNAANPAIRISPQQAERLRLFDLR
jgi:hypothetical protein